MKTRQEELIAYLQKPHQIIRHDKRASWDVMSKDVDHIINQTKNCIWFYAGEADTFYNMPANNDLCKIPYSEMAVEFKIANLEEKFYRFMVFVLSKTDDNSFKVTIIEKQGNGWCIYGSYYLILDEHIIRIMKTSYMSHGNDDESNKFMHMSAKVICSFLSCINCCNVKQVEHFPKRQPGKASTRSKPLYSFWTLEIDKSKNQTMGIPLGGTHASPRIHLRRGHARQYKPGVYCWVQPCLVGKKEAGVIHKDYLLKAA